MKKLISLLAVTFSGTVAASLIASRLTDRSVAPAKTISFTKEEWDYYKANWPAKVR